MSKKDEIYERARSFQEQRIYQQNTKRMINKAFIEDYERLLGDTKKLLVNYEILENRIKQYKSDEE